jgi:hypothetical protein
MAMPGPLGRTRTGPARRRTSYKPMTVEERRAQLRKSGQASKIAGRGVASGRAVRESVRKANIDPTRGGARPQAGKSVSAGRTRSSAARAQAMLDRARRRNRAARAAK